MRSLQRLQPVILSLQIGVAVLASFSLNLTFQTLLTRKHVSFCTRCPLRTVPALLREEGPTRLCVQTEDEDPTASITVLQIRHLVVLSVQHKGLLNKPECLRGVRMDVIVEQSSGFVWERWNTVPEDVLT